MNGSDNLPPIVWIAGTREGSFNVTQSSLNALGGRLGATSRLFAFQSGCRVAIMIPGRGVESQSAVNGAETRETAIEQRHATPRLDPRTIYRRFRLKRKAFPRFFARRGGDFSSEVANRDILASESIWRETPVTLKPLERLRGGGALCYHFRMIERAIGRPRSLIELGAKWRPRGRDT